MHAWRQRGPGRASGATRCSRSLCTLLLCLIAALGGGTAIAAEPGDSLTVSLLTMGPGAHPFTKFGHTAIWVHDARTGRDEVFNFGTFAFDSPTLLLDSIQGKLPYWLSLQGLRGTLASYAEQKRSLLASELELTASERLQLLNALRENATPEHRYYRYDYYRDNCATRVRDALDRVLGGRMHERARGPARMSYRAHTLRLVADDSVLYVALDLAIGRHTDDAISEWDEGFLPERLHDLATQTTVVRGSEELPLIRGERRLLESNLAPVRVSAPAWGSRYLAVGLVLATLLSALGGYAPRRPAPRVALGIAFLVLGASFGLLGCALGYLTFFSSHSAAASNFNVLVAPPWALGLAVAGVQACRNRPSAWRVAQWSAAAALGSSLLALGLHALTWSNQANWQELACALPLWAGSLAAAVFADGRTLAPQRRAPSGRGSSLRRGL